MAMPLKSSLKGLNLILDGFSRERLPRIQQIFRSPAAIGQHVFQPKKDKHNDGFWRIWDWRIIGDQTECFKYQVSRPRGNFEIAPECAADFVRSPGEAFLPACRTCLPVSHNRKALLLYAYPAKGTITQHLLSEGSPTATPNMPSIDPSSKLGVSLREHLGTGLYSDLIIKDSNGNEYTVHRNIVCGQSPVLANACKKEHGFKEAKTGVIHLEHDEPSAVNDMVEFMYTGSITIMEEENAMTQIAQAHALGEIYNIPELKELTATQFEEYLPTIWMNTTDFVNAVKIIYETVPRSGGVCAIREAAVHAIATHYVYLLSKPEFRAVMEDFGALGMDTLRLMARPDVNYSKKTLCRCLGQGEPGHVVELRIDVSEPLEMVDCYVCGKGQSNNTWSTQTVNEDGQILGAT